MRASGSGRARQRGRYDAYVTLDLLDRMLYLSVAITANALADIAGTELTFLGWRTLVILGDSSQPMRLKDLAQRLRICCRRRASSSAGWSGEAT